MFEYPGATTELAPTVYEGDRPIAFVAGFPRTIAWRGRVRRMLVNTFLTVAPDRKRGGLAAAVLMELLTRCRDHGFEGTFNFYVEGDRARGLVAACGRRLGMNSGDLLSIQYLMKRLDAPAADQAGEPVLPDHAEVFRRLAQREPKAPFARKWTAAEAAWQCFNRFGAHACFQSGHGCEGGLTGWVLETLGPKPIRSLFIEDVLWGQLEQPAQVALLRKLLNRAAANGAQLATVPLLGYTDYAAFRAEGFRRGRRLLHAHATMFDGEPWEPVPAAYLDVL